MTIGKTAPAKTGGRRGNDGSNGVRDHDMITQGYDRNLEDPSAEPREDEEMRVHYSALNLWIERKMKKECKGYLEMIRYADDYPL